MKTFAVCALIAAGAAPAFAVNPLIVSGEITTSDSLAFEPSTDRDFFFDLYEIEVNVAGSYDFTISALDTLAPYLGLYDGDFDFTDWENPAVEFQLFNSTSGTTESGATMLMPGVVYQVMIATQDFNPDASIGAYEFTVSGPAGSSITLIPAPAPVLALLGAALPIGVRRRR